MSGKVRTSTVEPQPRRTWYTGLPDMERSVTDYVASEAAGETDRIALDIWNTLQKGASPAVVKQALSVLESSRLAWFLQTVLELKSEKDEDDDEDDDDEKEDDEKEDAGAIWYLAEEDFDPAVAWLVRDLPLDLLLARRSDFRLCDFRNWKRVDMVRAGASRGNVTCVLLLARAQRTLHFSFKNKHESGELAGTLYQAAKQKSWEALSMLLELHTRAIPGLFELACCEEALALLADAVQEELPEAMYMLGRLLQDGVLLEEDDEQARLWFTKAAEAGSLDGKCALACLLMKDMPRGRYLSGSTERLEPARVLLEEGCAAGHGPSFLGRADYLQRTEPDNTAEILACLRKAAELGMTEEVCALLQPGAWAGEMLASRDIQAVLELPCMQTDPAARYQLALRRMREGGAAPKAAPKAAPGAAQNADAGAAPKAAQGADADAENDPCKALELLARAGYGPASATIGACWLFGLYGCEQSPVKARTWINKGVFQHNLRARTLACILQEVQESPKSRKSLKTAKAARMQHKAQDAQEAQQALEAQQAQEVLDAVELLADRGDILASLKFLEMHLLAQPRRSSDAAGNVRPEVIARAGVSLSELLTRAVREQDFAAIAWFAGRVETEQHSRRGRELAVACLDVLEPGALGADFELPDRSSWNLQLLAALLRAVLTKHGACLQEAGQHLRAANTAQRRADLRTGTSIFAPQTQPLTGWYSGFPALERILADYLASEAASKEDRAARALCTELQQGGDRALVSARLKALSSSRLAGFLLLLLDAESEDEDRRDAAMSALDDMAQEGFDPAITRRCMAITADMLAFAPKRWMHDSVAAGVASGNVYSVLLLARAKEKLYFSCKTSDERSQLASALYHAATKHSMDALSLLLRLYTLSQPDLFAHAGLASCKETLALLDEAVQQQLPEAMYLQGQLLWDGVLVARDWPQARQWFAKAAEGGSLNGKCALALALMVRANESGQPSGAADTWLAQAHALLEEGCAAEHGPSVSAMAVYLRQTDPDNTNALDTYLRKAAELGMAASTLSMVLLDLYTNNTGRFTTALCTVRMRSMKRDFATRHQMALRRLCTDDPDWTRENRELETLARAGYGPAAASLAECRLFGLCGYDRSPADARTWIDTGIAACNLRARTLACIEDEQGTDAAAESSRTLQLLAARGDILAGMKLCFDDALNSPENLRQLEGMDDMPWQEAVAKSRAIFADAGTELGELLSRAMAAADFGAIAWLAGEAEDAEPGWANTGLAETCLKALKLAAFGGAELAVVAEVCQDFLADCGATEAKDKGFF